jgi:TRAP-type C4-dicarboxylate transport system permease small subunit
MNFLTERLPRRAARWAELAVTLTALALFGMLAGYGGRLSWDDWHFGTTSPGMGLPQWLYSVWLPVLSALIALRLVGHLLRVWRRRAR